MPTYDVIVLGLGGYGSSAACHAARRGATVLGLEQFTPAHDRGSSHGETRIIRQAYFEHPDYVPLAISAYEHWHHLEELAGRKLFTPQGLIICGLPDGEVVAGTRSSSRTYGLPLDELSRDAAERRFPTFRLHDGHCALFEANGGYLAVEDCTRSHLEVAERFGADLRFQTPVVSWSSDGRTATVRTEREEFAAKNLIITAGAWASRTLDGLNVPLKVKRKFVAWFQVRPEFADAARTMPCFCFEIGSQFFYGFPTLDGTSLKLAEHLGGEPVSDPSHLDRTQTPADLTPLVEFAQRCLPIVEPKLVRHAVCMYTMTPDGNFIVDRHPRFENVVLACGFSGHGYKFASVLGNVLADLALLGSTSAPIGFLSLDRAALS